MSTEQNKITPWALNEKKFLDELIIDIAKKFWMDKQKAILLLKVDISKWLQELKNEIEKQDDEKLKNLWEKELEKLFFTLKWALEVIEKISKNEIQILKKDIESSIKIEEFKNNIEDYLPPNLLKKAKNPQNIHEHILGFVLGATNSILKTTEILFQIWAWILKTPYHLYMLIIGKAKTDSFKDI